MGGWSPYIAVIVLKEVTKNEDDDFRCQTF